MHYLDEGPADGPVVALVHGEPTWSFMFRDSIGPLVSAGFRTVVPDLVGFGRSDKPAEIGDYSYERHVAWLKDFFGILQVQDVVLVGHDWGGLLGLRLLTEVEGLVRAYVATNHGYPTGDLPANEALSQWQEFAASSPVFEIGSIVDNACTTDLAEEVVAAYDAPFPDDTFKAGTRAFPRLIPVTPDDPSSDAVRRSREVLGQWQGRFLTVYGEQDPIAGPADAMFQQLVPGAAGMPQTRPRGPPAGGGHNMPEDAGETLGELVARFAGDRS